MHNTPTHDGSERQGRSPATKATPFSGAKSTKSGRTTFRPRSCTMALLLLGKTKQLGIHGSRGVVPLFPRATRTPCLLGQNPVPTVCRLPRLHSTVHQLRSSFLYGGDRCGDEGFTMPRGSK